MDIKIKYFNNNPRLELKENGDWIDLYVGETVDMKAGEFKLIPLGVAMKLPRGHEANIVPRSSTFSKFGVLQTNSYGVIDSTYCGDEDEWFFPAYATRDTHIPVGARICQFRINRTMSYVTHNEVNFLEVNKLNNPNRGGHGSTGV